MVSKKVTNGMNDLINEEPGVHYGTNNNQCSTSDLFTRRPFSKETM
jgi:hypothetical protein